jgi:uroporphyrinogen decarboxylase
MGMNETELFSSLPRAEVIKALERKNPSRVPLIQTHWWGEGFEDLHGAKLEQFERYPEDATILLIEPVRPEEMGLTWPVVTEGAHDACVLIDDWAKLDEFIEKLPDPETDPQMDRLIEVAQRVRERDQYLLFGWWRLFFERPWGIRGMTNLMMDYFLAPDEIHRLHGALCDVYCRYLQRAIRELKPDGFWTSDDLGHQTQPFMSPQTFRELIKPYYVPVGQLLKENKMHWWLHSCGNNTVLLDDLIEVGVNVFHPVQRGTMDYVNVARDYGDRLTFLVGFDVQHMLPEGTPAQVREEVRLIIDTFDRSDGGMCLAAGNGILPGTPLKNIDAFLDEALRYGATHRRQLSPAAG